MYYTSLPCRSEVMERLSYDPLTGYFYWRPIKATNRYQLAWNRRYAGSRAGTTSPTRGGTMIVIQGNRHAAHRLAWLVVHGVDPGEMCVDHIDDAAPYRDAIANLRLATQSQTVAYSDSHTTLNGEKVQRPARGVRLHRKRYRVRVYHQGVEHKIGAYTTLEQAQAAYDVAALHYHGEFARRST